MPEIAEVETVRRVLSKSVVNKKIISTEIKYEKMIENDVKFFSSILCGNQIKSIDRKGKYLIFNLNNYVLISHLRMEGKFYYKKNIVDLSKHEHVRINFVDGTNLVYHDTRKFGKMKIISYNELEAYFQKLGFEPKDLKEVYLYEKLSKSNKNIKTLLLDQSIIAGLGNIYANEVLFKAKINPFKKGNELSKSDILNIIISSQTIVDKAIKEGGCTIKSYTSSLGVNGNYQNFLCVHMKENEKCKECGTLIKKMKIDGRSSYFCPKCQKQ